MIGDYQSYLDELILEVAAAQKGREVVVVDLAEIHARRFATCPDTWLTTAATTLHEQGYGIDWQSTDNTTFRINGRGLLRAQQIRSDRRLRRPLGRLAAIPRSDWIALAAFAVSIIALLKGD